MWNWQELTRSVEWIWLIWLGASALLAGMLGRVLRRVRRLGWRAFVTQQRGSAYALIYVMTVPVFMVIVCVVIESSIILVVKLGTLYAAYAAARSAIVWDSANPLVAEERIRLAAVHAMTPFASGNPAHLQAAGGGGSSTDASNFFQAYQRYSHGHAPSSYVTNKYQFAEAATRVIALPPTSADGEVTAEVSYEMPLVVPLVGRMLGQPDSWGGQFRSRVITSRVALPNEAPRNQAQRLGIDYVPF